MRHAIKAQPRKREDAKGDPRVCTFALLRFRGALFSVAGFVCLLACVAAPPAAGKAQDNPAEPPTCPLDYDETPLDDVLARAASAYGYRFICRPTVDGNQAVSLNLGWADLEECCAALELTLPIRAHIDRKRRIVELAPQGKRSAFYEARVHSIHAVRRRWVATNNLLGTEGGDFEATLKAVFGAALGLEPEVRFLENGTMVVCADPQVQVAIEQLLRVLASEKGGRDAWLRKQAPLHKRLSETRVVLACDEKPLLDLLSDISSKAGFGFMLEPGLYDETVSIEVGRVTAQQALDLICDLLEINMSLVGRFMVLARSPAAVPAGYAVYDVLLLAKTLAAQAQDALLLDVVGQIADSLSQVAGVAKCRIFGAHIVVGGDMLIQAQIEQELTRLGENKE